MQTCVFLVQTSLSDLSVDKDMLLSLMDRLLLSMDELMTDEPLSSELLFLDVGLPADLVLRMEVVRLGTSGGTFLHPKGPHSPECVET